MAKLSERKYGPKPGEKKRDHTSARFIARKAKFGGENKMAPRRPGSYAPRDVAGSAKGVSTGYNPRKNTGAGKFFPKGAHAAFLPKRAFAGAKDGRTHKSVAPKKPRVASASWGAVASWYDKHLSEADTYHEKVIQPNLLRALDAKKGERILDLACGQGFFTRALAKSGAEVSGVDISPELIAIAKAESPDIPYHVGNAEDLTLFASEAFDKALISLAIQNIENVEQVLREGARVLKISGELHIVMNHPAFRIPKQSSWGYDDKKRVQYRRVDEYLSNSKTEIEMHPGFADSPKTLSFHRPLQFYVKALAKTGFAITRLEEWISHKASDSGPRAAAENNARKEIPLFLYLKAVKLK